MIDHEVDRHQRLNELRILAQGVDRRAHGGKIDQQRHAGEVLEHDARDGEGDFLLGRRLGVPGRKIADVRLGNLHAIDIAQDGFQDDAYGNRESGDVAQAGLLQRGEGVVGSLSAVAEVELLT